jgi:hypothetical protein
MTLRDRLRRWWSPAQWEDDHPSERKQGEQPQKNVLGRWFGSGLHDNQFGESDVGEFGPSGRTDFERDFKKPG